MQAYILDIKGAFREIKRGRYSEKKQAFIWKEGGFLGIGAREREIPCDFNKAIPSRKERRVYYEYDGEKYNQLNLTNLKTENFNYKSFMDSWLAGEVAKKLGLHKPTDYLTVIGTIVLIIGIIILLIGYFTLQNLGNQINNALAPFNKTVEHQGILIQLLQNQTKHQNYIDNATIHLLQSQLQKG